jgi:hypothetical protein
MYGTNTQAIKLYREFSYESFFFDNKHNPRSKFTLSDVTVGYRNISFFSEPLVIGQFDFNSKSLLFVNTRHVSHNTTRVVGQRTSLFNRHDGNKTTNILQKESD